MRQQIGLITIGALLLGITGSLPGAEVVTHRDFQAVDEEGNSLFIHRGIAEVQLEGILLNSPECWVDPTPDPTAAPEIKPIQQLWRKVADRLPRTKDVEFIVDVDATNMR